MTSNNQNILDIQLLNKKKYIVLFSGLEFSPVEKIANDLSKDFNAIVLNYLHLNLDDSLDPLNTRVNDLLKKNEPQAIFIIAKTFPSDKLKIYSDLHINISLHKFAILNLDPAKRPDLPDLYIKSIQTTDVLNNFKRYSLNSIFIFISSSSKGFINLENNYTNLYKKIHQTENFQSFCCFSLKKVHATKRLIFCP